MNGISATSQKQHLADSWDQIRISTLVRAALIPSVIISILLLVLSIWRIRQPFAVGEPQYASIVVIAYVLLLSVLTGWYIRKIDLTSQHMLVLMMFSGFLIGLLVAIVKVILDYHGWSLLRLIGEPVTTALAAAVVGYIAYWQLSKLASH